ncbi:MULTISPECIES: T9SS type A sorting domain-containing protein [unclassified Polaribacter]|uniref:T9SS type A sorting domain-containing protein n=1 Tax=unclassified Polaribacter TaxID=196858 RepID=UPI0011BEF3E6|nr:MULTISPECIES: T9SS type A sorting domain-containing protein [unclassified Polaribacter]MDX6745916.1 T9SS type A sorting domain-containing protein [Polaribacter sp. PL03]TXD49308.1 T9SS type A sorting domain-containing protein [Polaribacter sp. IC073]
MNLKFYSNKHFYPLVLVLFFAFNISAQNVLLSSYGESKNNTGQVSYSVGQIINNVTSSSGKSSISTSIQQPYEVFKVLNADNNSIVQLIQPFPNPTKDILNIKVNNFTKGSLKYQLYNIKGAMVDSSTIDSSLSLISMKNKAIGFYFLKIINNQNLVQIFKIVKK